MRLTKILREYKETVREMKAIAKPFNILTMQKKKNGNLSEEGWKQYERLWHRALDVNNKAYDLMYEYRKTSETLKYRILFALHIVKRQNGFRVYNAEGAFRYTNLINTLLD